MERRVLTLDVERKVVLVAPQAGSHDGGEGTRDALIQAEITATFEQAIQARLNEAAIAARYDSIATAVSYAEEPRCLSSRMTVSPSAHGARWSGRMLMNSGLVLAGGREQPTVEAFLLELPELELPA